MERKSDGSNGHRSSADLPKLRVLPESSDDSGYSSDDSQVSQESTSSGQGEMVRVQAYRGRAASTTSTLRNDSCRVEMESYGSWADMNEDSSSDSSRGGFNVNRKSSVEATSLKPLCRHFVRTGGCKFGINCKFVHDPVQQISNSVNGSPSNSSIKTKSLTGSEKKAITRRVAKGGKAASLVSKNLLETVKELQGEKDALQEIEEERSESERDESRSIAGDDDSEPKEPGTISTQHSQHINKFDVAVSFSNDSFGMWLLILAALFLTRQKQFGLGRSTICFATILPLLVILSKYGQRLISRKVSKKIQLPLSLFALFSTSFGLLRCFNLHSAIDSLVESHSKLTKFELLSWLPSSVKMLNPVYLFDSIRQMFVGSSWLSIPVAVLLFSYVVVRGRSKKLLVKLPYVELPKVSGLEQEVSVVETQIYPHFRGYEWQGKTFYESDSPDNSHKNDVRPDCVSQGKIRHFDPKIAEVEFTYKVTATRPFISPYAPFLVGYGNLCEEKRIKKLVSYELVSQCLTINNFSYDSQDDVVYRRMVSLVSTTHSVNLNRFGPLSGNNVTQNSVQLAYLMFLYHKKANKIYPFPTPHAT